MKKSLIGWHAFSFHCKFVIRDNEQKKYICNNDSSSAYEKECHEDVCEMFKNAPVQQTTNTTPALSPAKTENGRAGSLDPNAPCEFDTNAGCSAAVCFSKQDCRSRDENGNPHYI